MKPTVMRANPDEDNYLLESRVRENCMHGSVGGEDVSPSLPNQQTYPIDQQFPGGWIIRIFSVAPSPIHS